MIGQNKGFAFIDVSDAETVRKTVFELDGYELMGRNIAVSLSAKKRRR